MRRTTSRWKHLNVVMGRLLTEARKDAGLKQDELAQGLKWEMGNRIISDIETGKRSIHFAEFFLIAKFLGRDPGELIEEFSRRADKKLAEIAGAWES